MFTYANFSCLTCCHLQICNHPMHRTMWGLLPVPCPPCYSSLGLSRLPGPLLHREEVRLGEIRGGHFQKRKDKDRKSQPFNTEPSLKSPSPAQLLF